MPVGRLWQFFVKTRLGEALAHDANNAGLILTGSALSLCCVQNRKKVLSEEPLFALNAADLTESEEKVFNIGRFLPSIRCAAL